MLPAIGAIAGAGASLFGGIMGNRTQASIAQAQLDAIVMLLMQQIFGTKLFVKIAQVSLLLVHGSKI
jgi:hypothetical protein